MCRHTSNSQRRLWVLANYFNDSKLPLCEALWISVIDDLLVVHKLPFSFSNYFTFSITPLGKKYLDSFFIFLNSRTEFMNYVNAFVYILKWILHTRRIRKIYRFTVLYTRLFFIFPNTISSAQRRVLRFWDCWRLWSCRQTCIIINGIVHGTKAI